MSSQAVHGRAHRGRADKKGGLLRGALAIALVVAAIAVVILTSPTTTRQSATPQIAETTEAGHATPSLDRFMLVSSSDDDGDGDGVNETHVRRYRNPEGDKIFSMTTQDRLWAWSLDTHGDDDTNIDQNYVVRDSDCDGRFDERYPLDAQFQVPTCLK